MLEIKTQPQSSKPDWKSRLDAYQSGPFKSINGWVDPVMFVALAAVQRMHDVMKIEGSLIEIGVHHGRFFLALDQLRRDGEPAVAIDVFEDQELNIDQSGKGSRKKFESYLMAHGRSPETTTIIAVDSTQIDSVMIAEKLARPRCRLFSVDGCHTAEHTANDLRIAQKVLTNGGVIFLDDFFSAFWPGVHEGFSRFMLFETPTVVPFAAIGGKLLLTTLATHAECLRHYEDYMSRFDQFKLKWVRMFGYDVLAAARMPQQTAKQTPGSSSR